MCRNVEKVKNVQEYHRFTPFNLVLLRVGNVQNCHFRHFLLISVRFTNIPHPPSMGFYRCFSHFRTFLHILDVSDILDVSVPNLTILWEKQEGPITGITAQNCPKR